MRVHSAILAILVCVAGQAQAQRIQNVRIGGAPGGSTLFSTTTLTGPSNTATETSLLSATGLAGSKTISANALSNGVVVHGELSGFYSTPAITVDNLTLRIKCGTTVLASKVVSGLVINASNAAARLMFDMHAVGNGASGALLINTIAEFTGTTLTPSEAAIVNTAAVAFDFTTACAFDVTAQWAAAQAGESISAVGSAWIPGPPAGNFVTASSTDTLTNKTLDCEGTGNTCTISVVADLPTAGCNNATAAPAFDIPTSGGATATCFGTTTTQGALDFIDASTTTATTHFVLPADWTGSVDIDLYWFANAASSNAVRWSVATGCVADAEAVSTGPSYNTASASNTSYTGTANQRKTTSLAAVSMTNCAAGETMYLQVQRIGGDAGDTLTATAELLDVRVRLRRAI
jgi:hypothetical protein